MKVLANMGCVGAGEIESMLSISHGGGDSPYEH